MKLIPLLLCFCFFSCFPFCVSLQNQAVSQAAAETPAEPKVEIAAPEAEDMLLSATCGKLIYFNQTDARWGKKNYGPQNEIATYGCGPTVLSMLVSSLGKETVPPDAMAKWCYENGFFSQNSGSYHSIIPQGSRAWGLNARSLSSLSYEAITAELKQGRLVVLLMGRGHFTKSGHFIILRDITADGNLLIADPKSTEHSISPWTYGLIRNEIKPSDTPDNHAWSIGR